MTKFQTRTNEVELTENFARANVSSDGVVTWNSNDRTPFDDMLNDFVTMGFITEADVAVSQIARKEQNDAFFIEYREAQANRSPEQIAEEQFEARAAFGPGETIVNVFTGTEFTT